MAYSFARIAQLNPDLIKKYTDLFEITTHEGRLFLLKVFQICGNAEVRKFLEDKKGKASFNKEKSEIKAALNKEFPIKLNVLEKPIKDAGDLDFLWCEFFITGRQGGDTQNYRRT